MPVLLGAVVNDMLYLGYRLQLLQLAALQPAQGLPPMEEVNPLSSLEKEAKVESIRLAVL